MTDGFEPYLPKQRAPRPLVAGHSVDCVCITCFEEAMLSCAPRSPRPPEKTKGWRTASEPEKQRRRKEYAGRLAEWNRTPWEAFCGPDTTDRADRKRYLDGLIRENVRVVKQEVGRWVRSGRVGAPRRSRGVAPGGRGRASLRDEVEAAAFAGLYAAARAYRPDEHPGVAFSAYARQSVRGAMLRYLRSEARRDLPARRDDGAGAVLGGDLRDDDVAGL